MTMPPPVRARLSNFNQLHELDVQGEQRHFCFLFLL